MHARRGAVWTWGGKIQYNQYVKAVGVDVTLHIYTGVAHWFIGSDRLEYDPAAAKLAWKRTFDFLKQNLSGWAGV